MKPAVLVIDDNESYLTEVSELLKDAGYEPITYYDPFEAIRTLKGTPAQCILLDYYMPGLDGEDILHLVHLKYPDIPIILCSGYIKREDPYFLHEGAFATLSKPFEHGVLLDTIDKALTSEQVITTIMVVGLDLRKARETLLRKLIIKALYKTNFNLTLAADLLGISRQCLFSYIKRLKLSY